jgi:hypothetical protein
VSAQHPGDPWGPAGDEIATTTVLDRFGTVMITGHRPKGLTPDEQAWMQVALARTMWRLRSRHGMKTAITGMAQGADLTWGLAALAAGVPVHAFVPFPTQTSGWPAYETTLWRTVLDRCEETTTVLNRAPRDRTEAIRTLHGRNDAMLDATAAAHTTGHGGLVVAVLKTPTGDMAGSEPTGGTASAVKKARKRGLPLLIHDPATQRIRRENWPAHPGSGVA